MTDERRKFCVTSGKKKKNPRNGQENIEHTPPVYRWTHKHKEEAACEALGNIRDRL